MVKDTIFFFVDTLWNFGVHYAVSCYNVGNITKCLIFEKVELGPRLNCVRALKKFNQI